MGNLQINFTIVVYSYYCSLFVRRTRLSTIGDRASPVAAARVWNCLPQHVTSASLSTFRSRLNRGVTTAGDASPVDTGDASPVRPTMSPLHQNDNRQFVFGADF